MAPRRTRKLGEFGLIQWFQGLVGTRKGVVLGIGDDTAVLELEPGRQLLVTCDSLVADVHFRLQPERAYDTGRKAMAVNVSDIAAMGGRPTYALTSLSIPPDLPWSFLEALLQGLTDEARVHEVAIVGGDTVSSPHDFGIHITLLGEVAAGRAVTRGGARPGDVLCVTHHLGAAAAGLALLENPHVTVPDSVRTAVVRKHLRPEPRLRAGWELAQGTATAMIDLSDGLAGDVRHLCRESGVGAVIYAHRLPIAEETRIVAAALGEDPVRWALTGGEDYELLFSCAPPPWAPRTVLPESGTPVTVIGAVLPPEEGLWLELAPGKRVPLELGGFTHF